MLEDTHRAIVDLIRAIEAAPHAQCANLVRECVVQVVELEPKLYVTGRRTLEGESKMLAEF